MITLDFKTLKINNVRVTLFNTADCCARSTTASSYYSNVNSLLHSSFPTPMMLFFNCLTQLLILKIVKIVNYNHLLRCTL